MPDDGGGRAPDGRPGLDHYCDPDPTKGRAVSILAQPADRVVVELADLRVRRIRRIDGQSGPWWPSWRCCWSWTTAEASRRAG